jgi:hypothetical protein
MPTDLHITGEALAEFTFDGLPSWNVVMRKHRMQQSSMTKALRLEGKTLAQNFMRKFYPGREYLIEKRALVVVRVQPPHEGVMDTYNVDIKDVCDGFTDAMVWPDDEWAWLPVTVFMWDGIGNREESRTVIEVHELGRLVVNGEARPLPRGRERVQE